MTREELEKAIENCDTVYVADDIVIEVELTPESEPDLKLWDKLYIKVGNNNYKTKFPIDRIYKTKAEAKHYLHHANVERIERLPFLTWEEFLENKNFEFFDKNGILTWLYTNTSKTSESIHLNNRFKKLNDWGLTEENFYKAYDECKRLFLGE